MSNKIIIKNLNNITKIFPVKKIQLYKNEVVIFISNIHIQKFLLFLKLHTLCQYSLLSSISGVDYIKKQYRFEIVYELLSIRYNNRIRIKTFTDLLGVLTSSEQIYASAGWFESEIFDMFGVFFKNHTNLRRLLTDYGFQGYPLRKDFPLSGYIELKYDAKKKRIISEYLELSQEYRTFDFLNPWNFNKI